MQLRGRIKFGFVQQDHFVSNGSLVLSYLFALVTLLLAPLFVIINKTVCFGTGSCH